MSRITRIATPTLTSLPAKRAGGDAATAVTPVKRILPPQRRNPQPPAWQQPATAGKPAAPFLAQFIDQHWLWPGPRARMQNAGASHAYLEADALTDKEHSEIHKRLDRFL